MKLNHTPTLNHTATPWINSFDGDECQIGTADGRFVAMTLPCESNGLTNEDYENAKHIVKCVNAHDELVAYLTGMVDLYEDNGGATPLSIEAREFLAKLEK